MTSDIPDMQEVFLQALCDITWSQSWSVLLPDLICCSCHWCIINALQTVKGHDCKVMVLHRAMLFGTRMLYLSRDCTSHDADSIPRILCFIIGALVYAN